MASQTNRFAVIEGGGQLPSPWQDLPQTVVARSPFNRECVALYRLSKHTFAKLDSAKRRQPFFDAWTCILGEVPLQQLLNVDKEQWRPEIVFAVGRARLLSRRETCRRRDTHGFDVVAFVSRPAWGVCYSPSLSCPISWWSVPNDIVFVTYVRLDHPPSGRYGTATASEALVRGVITHWHFVEADPEINDLPIGYQVRYRRRLW